VACVVSFNISSPYGPRVSAHSCRVKYLDMCPVELLELREIADKQMTDRPAVAHSNYDVVKDSAGDTDHP